MSRVPGGGVRERAAVVAVDGGSPLRARLVGPRPAARQGGQGEDGRDLDVLLGLVAPFQRPLLQRAVLAGSGAAGRWLCALPERTAGWGAGPERAWCAW